MNRTEVKFGRRLSMCRPERVRGYTVRRGIVPVPPEERLSLIASVHPEAVVLQARLIGLPEEVQVEGYPFGYWSILRAVTAVELEDSLRDAGWTFIRMEPHIKTWGWGLQVDAALGQALRKAVAAVERENLNALEIGGIRVRRIWGMCMVRITAYARQVQRNREYSYGGCAPVFRPAA